MIAMKTAHRLAGPVCVLGAGLAALTLASASASAQKVTGEWLASPEPITLPNGEPVCAMVYNAPGGRSILLQVFETHSSFGLDAPDFIAVPQQANLTLVFPSGFRAEESLRKPNPQSPETDVGNSLTAPAMLFVAEQFATPGDLTANGQGWSVRYAGIPSAVNEAAQLRQCLSGLDVSVD
jgi:hypothetical protein